MNGFDTAAKGLALYVQLDAGENGTPFDALHAIADKCAMHFVLCITKDAEDLEARFMALPPASQCQFKFKVFAV